MHNYSCYLEESGEIPGSFAISWEQRKVSGIGNIVTGSTPKTSVSDNYGGEFLFVSPADIQENRYVDETITTLTKKGFDQGRKIREKASLFVSIGSTIGKVAQINQESTTNQQINAVEPYDNFDDDFIFTSLENISGSIKAIASNQAVPIVNKTTFGETEIQVPLELGEQQKIGQYFVNLDHLITLHQRKQCILYIMKKILCGKSKQLEKSISWEQRKLGDVSESFSGGTPSVGNKRYYDGSIPFIRSAEINSESTELFLTEEGLTNSSARMVSKGDILYALYGATSGEVGRSRINGAINQAILAILPHDGYDSKFLMQWLRKSKQSITDVYLQGGQGNLSGAIVKALEVDFPSVIEQRQIGNYFQSFDNLITLHQRKP